MGEWTRANWDVFMEKTLAMEGRIPFSVVLKESGQPVGSTSYFDIRSAHRGLEIGYTWYAVPYQGTQVNPENKYLLLRHAFETLGAIRVQLKTDKRNLRSQAAIAKLGAKLEGTLRKHSIMEDGYIRDTVMFSITDEEWPGVKAGLEARLGYVP
jgi:RimJ/RimL family protein N-acetyltransferase